MPGWPTRGPPHPQQNRPGFGTSSPTAEPTGLRRLLPAVPRAEGAALPALRVVRLGLRLEAPGARGARRLLTAHHAAEPLERLVRRQAPRCQLQAAIRIA